MKPEQTETLAALLGSIREVRSQAPKTTAPQIGDTARQTLRLTASQSRTKQQKSQKPVRGQESLNSRGPAAETQLMNCGAEEGS